MPSADELSALPHAELAERLAGAYQLIAELTGQAQRLQARIEELERQVRGDSSDSSRPPSWDSPYKKKPRDPAFRVIHWPRVSGCGSELGQRSGTPDGAFL